jgi:hypothetical protein
MKKTITIIATASLVILQACNNATEGSHDKHTTQADTAQTAPVQDNAEITSTAVTFTDVNPVLAAALKEVTDHYLHIKNALVNDNSGEAAGGAEAMEKALAKIDKSLFSTVQKKVYDELGDEMKEHAEHIAKKSDDIKHQRSHFASLSEDVYALVKAFGAGRALYHDHCPMYNDNKGGMWISETKEIKNPYFGAEMLTCGSAKEVIR